MRGTALPNSSKIISDKVVAKAAQKTKDSSKINSDELGLGIINEEAFNLLVEKAKENKAIEIKESEIQKEKANTQATRYCT